MDPKDLAVIEERSLRIRKARREMAMEKYRTAVLKASALEANAAYLAALEDAKADLEMERDFADIGHDVLMRTLARVCV